MTTKIGDLAVRIFADTGDLTTGLGKAKEGLKEVASEARAGATSIAKYGAAAAAAGAAMTAAIVVSSAQAAKEIKNLSAIANTSTSTFQKMAFGAKSVGIEQDKLSDILKDFNDRVGDFNATGGGPMVDFFEKIAPKVGITAQAFQNLSGDQALQLYVSSLEKANLSQADMVFYMEAMASDSTALLPLLQNNGKAFAEQAKRAEELGLALSDMDTERLVQLNSRISASKEVFSSLSEEISAKLSPAIMAATSDFESMIKEAGGVGSVATNAFNKVIDAGAFVANAIDGVGRTFEVLGKTAALIGLGIGETMLMLADSIVNKPVQAVNELIEALNTLPSVDIAPVSLTGFGETIQNELGIVRSAIDIGLKDIDEVLQRPLAGSAFKKYIENAKIASDEAAAAMIGGKKKEFDGMVEWDAIIGEELAAQKEAKKLSAIEEDAFLNELIAAGEQKRYEIAAESAQKQNMLDEMQAANRKAALGGLMDNLASLMGSKSRKMFEIGKVAAIANTVVSSIQGAQQAYTALSGIPVVGPALGIAAAGAAVAAGAVRIQAINAQSFSKGTVSGAAASSTAENIGNQVSGGQSGPSQVQYIQGINPGDLYSGSQLVDLINNAQENGARLVVL